jgi:hypothetical protein
MFCLCISNFFNPNGGNVAKKNSKSMKFFFPVGVTVKSLCLGMVLVMDFFSSAVFKLFEVRFSIWNLSCGFWNCLLV